MCIQTYEFINNFRLALCDLQISRYIDMVNSDVIIYIKQIKLNSLDTVTRFQKKTKRRF